MHIPKLKRLVLWGRWEGEGEGGRGGGNKPSVTKVEGLPRYLLSVNQARGEGRQGDQFCEAIMAF